MSERVVSLVTGCNGGIGVELVRALARRGDVVVGTDLGPEPAAAVADYYQADITDEGQCVAMVTGVARTHGKISVAVNAAGILGSTCDPFETSTSEFEQVMRTNTLSAFTLAREVGRTMRDQRDGSLVFFSSVAAKEARREYLPYNAAKVAVLHLVWDFALILGPYGVSVNAVCPGPVDTAMWAQKAADLADGQSDPRAERAAQIPMGRFAQPAEVARVVVNLTDPVNRYLTGLSLDVAGGAHLGFGT